MGYHSVLEELEFTVLNPSSLRDSNHAVFPFCVSGNQILASGSVQIPRFILLESGGLQITPVFLHDAGNYTCFAVNSEGSLNAFVTLTVWSKDNVLFKV